MSFTKRYTGEYGYDLVFNCDSDLSAATTVVVKAQIGEVIKSLSATVSPATVATARVTQDFFDIVGVGELQLQATFASAKRYSRNLVKIEIEKGIE